jgi:16S rRNA (adenine1518-N6/adenine1519-N6)-dimethyltransferase
LFVKPKKSLGQHFLNDLSVAERIVSSLQVPEDNSPVLEIGPGMGVLTNFLIPKLGDRLYLNELDREAIAYIKMKYPSFGPRLLEGDFLRLRLIDHFPNQFAIIGNFPYNISSQIFFSVLENKDRVTQVVCMLQKEVAVRLASKPGNKDYGILSVLLQAFYSIEFLFQVDEHQFNPPPKVKSGVIRLVRNEVKELDCDEKLFKQVVKQGFNNRRKTLRNALKPLNLPETIVRLPLLDKRAEQLSVNDFIGLTLAIAQEKTA